MRDQAMVAGALGPGAIVRVVVVVLAATALIALNAPRHGQSAAAWWATPASTHMGTSLDPELTLAWERFGCEINPGNPACATISLAATCAAAADRPGCDTDSDGDGCVDIAEVRAGFDAFAAEDCLAGATGEPVINCLFLFETFGCAGERESDGNASCAGAARMPQGALPYTPGECAETAATPVAACPPGSRDPTCDGFAPALYPPFGEQRGALPAGTPVAVYSGASA